MKISETVHDGAHENTASHGRRGMQHVEQASQKTEIDPQIFKTSHYMITYWLTVIAVVIWTDQTVNK